MKLGTSGATVRALQWALLAKGYDLPRWGADGRLGLETWQSVADFARDHDLAWSADDVETAAGAIPARVVAAVLTREVESRPATSPASRVVIDIVSLRNGAPPPKTRRDANGRVVRRPASSITGITIHQTSCVYGVSARQVREAGGDAQLALHRRLLNVACHVVALRTGTVLKTNDFATYVHHANGLNQRTLGLEIEGIYSGLAAKARSPAPSQELTPLSPEVVDTARQALKFMVDQGASLGMPIKWIFAHRQSSGIRRPDPGEEIWRRVVLEYAVSVLGLRTRPEFTTGSGSTIPRAWDPTGIGPY